MESEAGGDACRPFSAATPCVLAAARTSTVKLDTALQQAASRVGADTAPTLRARFINSMNRAFQNVSVSILRDTI